MTTILTYPNHLTIDLANPVVDSISIEDIAWSLSLEGRYSNFLSQKYPVGEHCIHAVAMGQTSAFLEFDLNDTYVKNCFLLRLLLHDAAEAYLKDIPGPIKKLLPDYRALEKKLQSVIYRAFHLGEDSAQDSAVKVIDVSLGAHERAVLRNDKRAHRVQGFILDLDTSLVRILGKHRAKKLAIASLASKYLAVFDHLHSAVIVEKNSASIEK